MLVMVETTQANSQEVLIPVPFPAQKQYARKDMPRACRPDVRAQVQSG